MSASLTRMTWQIEQIEAGLREADAGDFATDDEVAALFAKWTKARVASRKTCRKTHEIS